MSEAPFPQYRLYSLDPRAQVVSNDWLDAKSDFDAIAIVARDYPGLQCEIWSGKRLVARVDPGQGAAESDAA